MERNKFRQVVCIFVALMIFISSVGVSFIKHHCSATNTTELFINELHDCSGTEKHVAAAKEACKDDTKCSCIALKVSIDDGISLKCEKCCKDSSKLFALNIPISVESATNQIEKVWHEITLFCASVSFSIINCCVTFVKESPPLSNLFSTKVLIHFISVLLI